MRRRKNNVTAILVTVFIGCVLGQPAADVYPSLQNDGRLLIFDAASGSEGTVCSDNWDSYDAAVICRSLGLASTGRATYLPRDYGRARAVFGMYCTGSEYNITDCQMDTVDTTHGQCSNMEDAGVECGVSGGQHQGMLFVDNHGRVMHEENGTIGTICSNQWDNEDAGVLCRHLGYGMSGLAFTLPRDPTFNRSTYGVHCFGNETNMFECRADEYDTTFGQCDYMDDAAVECQGFTGGQHQGVLFVDNHGRVMHEENGTIGTICSNQWDNEDAGVLCRHLGYGMSGLAFTLPRDPTFNRSTYGVHCFGNETNMFECRADDTTFGQCDYMDDAAVECQGFTGGQHQGVLFVDNHGRVMHEENGTIGTICSNQWDNEDAGVLCRHLGYGMSGLAFTLPRDPTFNRSTYGVHCFGNETNMFECRADEYDTTFGQCDYMDDAAVECQGFTGGQHQGVLFVDNHGRVMHEENGTIGTICSNQWDNEDAGVLCRHLGYGMSGLAFTLPRDPTFNRSTYGVHCFGNETNMFECKADEYDTTFGQCGYMDDAAVECQGFTGGQHQGVIFVDNHGRVMHEENGTIGTICSNQWDNEDAGVLCRHLGYGMSGLAFTLPRDPTFNRSTYGVHCFGNETNMFECKADEYDTTFRQCDYMDDAAVECQGFTGGQHQGVLFVDNHGRVMHEENGTIGTICSNEWDNEDAGVLCRHLGYGMSGLAFTLPRDPTFNRSTYGVHCFGNETNMFECRADEYDSTFGQCDYMDDAAVECQGFTGGQHQGVLFVDNHGRVMHEENGTIGTICSNQWDNEDAGVLCRHLGYGMSGLAFTLPRDPTFNRSTYGVHCFGNETNMFECRADEYDTTFGQCDYMDDAAVECQGFTGGQHQGVLFVDNHGRVMHEENGTIGTICSNQWDNEDAGVLCRHLGYGMSGLAFTLPRDPTFNRSTYGVHCFGNETNMFECKADEYDTTFGRCDYMDDAAVECQGFTGGQHQGVLFVDNHGRVMHEENGTIGTICSNEWDNEDAGVLCRHLGYGMSGLAFTLPRDPTFNRSTYGVHCFGNETNMFECRADEYDTTFGQCDYMDDAAVECQGFTGGQHQGVLFVDNHGRVMHEENGTIGTICSNEWDNEDAGVLCRHLGYGMSGLAFTLPRDPTFNRSTYGVHCFGNETNMFECRADEYDTTFGQCDYMDDAAVECQGFTGGQHQGVLFVDNHGRVMHEENGTIGTICSNQWDNEDAGVLCRHLGYGMSGLAFTLPRDPTFNRSTYGVHCFGNETNMFECRADEYDTTFGQCDYMDDAAVECQGFTGGQHQGVLFVDNHGRVMHEENGTIGTICSNQWDNEDAGVLCRHLGYGMSGLAFTLPRDPTFNRSTYGVHCFGNETNMFECRADEYDTTFGQCDYMDDAAVECQGFTGGQHQGVIFVDNHGRVMHEENGTIGTICSNEWDNEDAGVLCRHLGYGMSGLAFTLPRDPTFNRSTYGVHCFGNETNMFECRADEYDTTFGQCDYMDDAAVECQGFTGGQHQGVLFVDNHGRVMHEENGTIGTICSNQWDNEDAGVLCRHLGYGMSGLAFTLPRDPTFNRSTYGVHCFGNETNMFECRADEYDTTFGQCDYMDDAAVECQGFTGGQHQGVLFVDNHGRVMHEENGTIGTICSNQWDNEDAGVLCRHLGYGMSGLAFTLPRDPTFNRSTYGVHCFGNETNMFECRADEYDTTFGQCDYMDDAAVECQGFTGGQHQGVLFVDNHGRVMHEENGTIGTICSNQWDNEDAGVLCRHLGYGMSGLAFTLPRDPTFNRSTYGVHCFGNETNMFECRADEYDTTFGQCDYMDDAAVECQGFTGGQHQGVLFVDNHGRVMHEENGTIGTICSNQWDNEDAGVLCRHLGYGMSGLAFTLPRDPTFNRSTYGVHCFGNETNMFECRADEYDTTFGQCDYMDDAAVECQGFTGGQHQGVLFVDNHGRVMHEENGTIGTICSNQWDNEDAGVLCRHLGYGMSGLAFTLPRDPTFNRSTYGVHCFGNETNMFECRADEYDTTFGQCDYMDDAAVECQGFTGGQHQGVLFVDNHGRVMHEENGTIGTICSNQWDNEDAGVLCRHLGYGMSGLAFTLPRDPTFNRSTYGVHCFGNETNMFECRADEYDTTFGQCDYMDDAAVECQGFTGGQHQGVLFVDNHGRVMHEENGTIGTICSNQWDNEDAGVLCRHLGYGMSGLAFTLPRDPTFNRSTYGVHCFGNETNMFECRADEYDTTFGQCDYMDDAAVECIGVNASSTALPTYSSQFSSHSSVSVYSSSPMFLSTSVMSQSSSIPGYFSSFSPIFQTSVNLITSSSSSPVYISSSFHPILQTSSYTTTSSSFIPVYQFSSMAPSSSYSVYQSSSIAPSSSVPVFQSSSIAPYSSVPVYQSSIAPSSSVPVHQSYFIAISSSASVHQFSSMTPSSSNPVYQSSSIAPSSSVPVYQSSSMAPSSYVPVYQSSSMAPSLSVPVYQSSSMAPSSSVPVYQSSSMAPSSSVPVYQSSSMAPSSSVPVYQSSSMAPSSSVPVFQSSSIVPSSSVLVYQSSSMAPSSSVPVYQSSMAPSSSVPVFQSSIVPSSSVLVYQSSSMAPSSSVPVYQSSSMAPSSSVPVYQSSSMAPSSSVPVYQSSSMTPSSSVPVYQSSSMAPSSSVPVYQSSSMTPSSSVPVYQSSSMAPSSYVPVYQSSSMTPSSSVPVYQSSSMTPSSSVPVYQSSSMAPSSSVPVYQSSTIVPSSSVPVYQSSSMAPSFSVPVYQSSSMAPSSSVTVYQSSSMAPSFSVSNYQSSSMVPSSSVPVYQSSFMAPSSSVPVYQSSSMAPSSSLPVYQSSSMAPSSSVPVHQSSSITPSSSNPVYQSQQFTVSNIGLQSSTNQIISSSSMSYSSLQPTNSLAATSSSANQSPATTSSNVQPSSSTTVQSTQTTTSQTTQTTTSQTSQPTTSQTSQTPTSQTSQTTTSQTSQATSSQTTQTTTSQTSQATTSQTTQTTTSQTSQTTTSQTSQTTTSQTSQTTTSQPSQTTTSSLSQNLGSAGTSAWSSYSPRILVVCMCLITLIKIIS